MAETSEKPRPGSDKKRQYASAVTDYTLSIHGVPKSVTLVENWADGLDRHSFRRKLTSDTKEEPESNGGYGYKVRGIIVHTDFETDEESVWEVCERTGDTDQWWVRRVENWDDQN